MPDTPIVGSSHGQKVTFRSLVVRLGSVSSMPHLVPQPVSFDVSRIPDSEDSFLHPKVKRMREDASIALHSLQLMAE